MEFEVATLKSPTRGDLLKPDTQTLSVKKKKPSKYTSSEIEHAESLINAPQPYLVGAALSPAIIPLTYYPIQTANFGTITNNNAKKTSSNNNRSRPSSPMKKTQNESHRNVIPLNAVPLVWYPISNPSLQRDLGSNRKHSTTKSPVLSQSQMQAMNVAAYHNYVNNLNKRQKHSN